MHLQRFVETEKNKNETWRLQERLSGVMGAMEDALLDAYHGDQGAMELAKYGITHTSNIQKTNSEQ